MFRVDLPFQPSVSPAAFVSFVRYVPPFTAAAAQHEGCFLADITRAETPQLLMVPAVIDTQVLPCAVVALGCRGNLQ